MNFTQGIFALICGILLAFIVRNIFYLFSSLGNYTIHKKRLKQLKFNQKKALSNEEQTKEFIDKLTTPIISYIIPKLKMVDTKQLEKDLKITGWDKYFTATQYKAMNILLKIVGSVMFLILVSKSLFIALIWVIAFWFLFGFLFRNSVKNKKENLLSEFPDFIRICQGYLTADMPLANAIENSIEYVGDTWRPILQEFVVNCEIYSIEDAIDKLSEETDIFEVRELMALIKLSIEQGIDIRTSFERHADKVRSLQLAMVSVKIAKRQIYGILLQGPLILTLFATLGLPIFSSMTSFTSM